VTDPWSKYPPLSNQIPKGKKEKKEKLAMIDRRYEPKLKAQMGSQKSKMSMAEAKFCHHSISYNPLKRAFPSVLLALTSSTFEILPRSRPISISISVSNLTSNVVHMHGLSMAEAKFCHHSISYNPLKRAFPSVLLASARISGEGKVSHDRPEIRAEAKSTDGNALLRGL
jgi:hypothetical protein